MSDGIKFGDAAYIRRLLILFGLILLTLVAWQIFNVLLLAFGAILVAIILHAAAGALVHYAHVPKRYSLALASLLIVVGFLGLLIFFGATIRAQLASVLEQLPIAIDAFGRKLGLGALSDDIAKMVNEMPRSGIALQIAGIGGTVISGLADFLLVIIAGLYIAASPNVYVTGLVKLFPIHLHDRVESSLAAAGEALRLWLTAQLIAMSCVGVMSALAFWMIGLPSPFALGLIAGLLDFIPFLGPFLGALPAIMISFTLGGETVLWTALAVLIVQQLEGNVIFPLVGRRMVNIPPALALFAIVAGGAIFGTIGLVFGFPLAVLVYVLIKKLYVREMLGEATTLPGEPDAARESEGVAPTGFKPRK